MFLVDRRKYKYWSDTDIRKLVALRNDGIPWIDIAFTLNRSVGSCKAKYKSLVEK